MRAPFAKFCTVIGLLLAAFPVVPPVAQAGPSDVVDLDGTPDLIVDQAALHQHWIVRVEDFAASSCAVQEDNLTPGEHTVVRFTVSTPNIGDADLFLGDPNDHIRANDGLYELPPATSTITSATTRCTS